MSQVGMGGILGRGARLGSSAQVGSQLGGVSPLAITGRDEIHRRVRHLSGEAKQVATKYEELTRSFDPKIKQALRRPFNHECSTIIEFQRTLEGLHKPDVGPQALESIRLKITRFAVSEPAQFETNIQMQRVRFGGEDVAPLSEIGESNKADVLRIYDALRDAFAKQKKDALGIVEAKLLAMAERSLSVPRMETLPIPSNKTADMSLERADASGKPEPAALNSRATRTSELPSKYLLASGVADTDRTFAQGVSSTVAVFFGGKGNLVTANISDERAREVDGRLMLNDFQQWGFVQLPGSPVAPIHWNGGAERIKDAIMEAARKEFGDSSEKATKLKLERGLVSIQDLGEPKDSRRFLGRLVFRSPGYQPSSYATLGISIIPPEAIEQCGDRFKRADQRLFMANLAITMPKQHVAAAMAVLGDGMRSRAALLGLLDGEMSYSSGVKEVVAGLREGIFEPLARKLHKFPDGKKWWELQTEEKRAVVGWFDCVNASPETLPTALRETFAASRKATGA